MTKEQAKKLNCTVEAALALVGGKRKPFTRLCRIFLFYFMPTHLLFSIGFNALGTRFARRVCFPMGRKPPQGAVMKALGSTQHLAPVAQTMRECAEDSA